MSVRYLPPAYSPVSAGSFAGGLRGLAFGGPAGIDQWLARRYNVDAVLLVDSGTSALRLAIESTAAEASARPRVALPAYGCYDLATAAIGAGSEVAFYDLDPLTLGPDWSSFNSVLSERIHAVVLVHQYGLPVDLDRARSLAEAQGALVIEDAAQGAGAWWRHRRLGAWGDLGVLSFGRGKGMTAGGGGALLARGPRGVRLLETARARLARGERGTASMVRLATQALLSHPILYGVPARMPWLALGDTPFHEPWVPRTIAAAQAGVVGSAAVLADDEANTRRSAAFELAAALGESPYVTMVTIPVGEGTSPGWLRLPVMLATDKRAQAAEAAFRRLGIIPGYPAPLPMLPVVRRQSDDAWPGAERLARSVVTLPVHRWVTPADRSRIVKLLAF